MLDFSAAGALEKNKKKKTIVKKEDRILDFVPGFTSDRIITILARIYSFSVILEKRNVVLATEYLDVDGM